MTPQELKNSILQRAIQGKLVEQRPEEGTAEKLYQQIQTEKQALIKAGKIKKDKPLPEIAEDEKPFDIPESWKWVRLNEVATSGLGKTLNKATDSGKMCRYLCSINVYWDGIKLDTVKEAPFTEADREKYLLQKGDLLICEGGDAGRCAIWNSDEEMYYQNALHRVRFYGDISVEYFRAIFELYKGTGIIKKHCKGETIQHLVQAELYSILFPLPPLAEQKRIVAKIEELLPLIDRYEAAWSRLEEFNKRFPGDMQKSLLQMANQGKLVEQRPEEGTGEELFQQIQAEKQALIKAGKIKKDKPLPEITEDERPFDIPESWKWVRIGSLFEFINGDRGKNYPSKDKLSSSGEIPFISAINMQHHTVYEDGLLYVSQKQYDALGSGKLKKGDFVVCIRGSLGKCCVYPYEKGAIASSLVILRQYGFVLPEYFMYYLESLLFFSEIRKYDNGTAQPNLSAKDAMKFLMPLPPFAEQKRIVAKLEELLPLCEMSW